MLGRSKSAIAVETEEMSFEDVDCRCEVLRDVLEEGSGVGDVVPVAKS